MDTGPDRAWRVDTDDGTAVAAAVYRPSSSASGVVVLVVPAMGVRARSYHRVAEALAAEGATAVTMDLRGHGDSEVRPSRQVDFGYHELVTLDIAAIVRACRERFPGSSLVLLGHSLGGQLGALYAGAFPTHLDGLALVSACSVDHRGWDFPLDLGVLAGTQAARLVAELLGVFPGKKLRFAGVEARGVIRDWSVNGRSGQYRVARTELDYEAAMARATVPVLGISFGGEALARRGACRNLWAKLGGAPVTEVHLDRDALGEARGHFGWLRTPDVVVQPLAGWMEDLRGS